MAYGPSSGAEEGEATMKRAAALAAADHERQVDEDFINARLAYQDDQRQRSKPPRPSVSPRSSPPMSQQQQEQQPGELTYAQLAHEPRRNGSPTIRQSVEPSPVYAKVQNTRPKSKMVPIPNDDSSLASESFVLGSEYGDDSIQQPTRKSYVPLVYRKESPEVQMKQQAVNDQLKDAVKNINHRETDF